MDGDRPGDRADRVLPEPLLAPLGRDIRNPMPESPARAVNALSLCGGGSRGAIEVGLYQALTELRIPIHMIFGTSTSDLLASVASSSRVMLR